MDEIDVVVVEIIAMLPDVVTLAPVFMITLLPCPVAPIVTTPYVDETGHEIVISPVVVADVIVTSLDAETETLVPEFKVTLLPFEEAPIVTVP